MCQALALRSLAVTLTLGSFCSGYGGLDLAVEQVFDAETRWQFEVNPAAARILTERFPGIPNHGDLTRVDWSRIEPVSIVAAGYPCQPFSQAGKKQGTNDERHLWPYIAQALRALQPRFVILENVAGHRRIGFDVVLGDLAALGFDANWTSVRASDVGAPHERERLFILATNREAVPDTPRQRRHQGAGLRADTTAEVGRLFSGDGARDPGVRWLDYTEAVQGWEAEIGRVAPAPVVTGRAGGVVPNPRFVEWMQGLPDGWVTDVQGLTAEQQIEALGNGVVPQQARAALDELLSYAFPIEA